MNPGPKSSSRECFSICHWNLNSISTQSYTEVSLLTADSLIHNFDIIYVSETFLNSETAPNDPNLEIPGYNIYRVNHSSNFKTGGVCIFYKVTLPLRVLNIANLNECINFEVYVANKIYLFIYLYRSPSQTQFQISKRRISNIQTKSRSKS